MGASSTFANAQLTKIIIIGTSILSLLLSGHHHYLDLPLVPHLTRDFQLWRIFGHHLACSNSADLFLIVILLWQISVPVERRFGSVKYASFLIVSMVIGSLLELVALVIIHQLFNHRAIPSGPFLITFAILYQHHRTVPSLYDYKIGKIQFDSHSLIPEFLSLVLSFFNPISSLIGLIVGWIYRSDQLNLKNWRINKKITLLNQHIQSHQTDHRRISRPNHVLLEDDPRLDSSLLTSRRSVGH